MDDSALLADAKFIVLKIAMASTDVHSCELIGVDIGVHQLDVAIVICAEQSVTAQSSPTSRGHHLESRQHDYRAILVREQARQIVLEIRPCEQSAERFTNRFLEHFRGSTQLLDDRRPPVHHVENVFQVVTRENVATATIPLEARDPPISFLPGDTDSGL